MGFTIRVGKWAYPVDFGLGQKKKSRLKKTSNLVVQVPVHIVSGYTGLELLLC